jgi:hypothetical protein
MGQMAKAVRGRRRKTVARKVTAPAKRKQATTGMTSGKFRALVNNLSAQELDELLKAATARKNEEVASAKASRCSIPVAVGPRRGVSGLPMVCPATN